jgi:hypothetical protein
MELVSLSQERSHCGGYSNWFLEISQLPVFACSITWNMLQVSSVSE